MTDVFNPKKFMIMTPWGRVGSNMIMDSIRQLARDRSGKYDNEGFNGLTDASEQEKWLRRFFTDSEGLEIIGSKQNVLSIREPRAVGRMLGELGVSLIRMRRANVLKVAISQLRAEIYAQKTLAQNGAAKWGVRVGQQPLGPAVLDPKRFLSAVKTARHADETLLAFRPDLPTLDIDYREIQADPVRIARYVCRWLGLEVRGEVSQRFIKATPDDLASAVPNLAELRAVLERSRMAGLAPLFDE